MPTWQYWRIYKIFNDPPGTPDNVKCVNCRYASAVGCFGLSAVSAYGVKKTIGPHFYVGCVLSAATFVAFTTGFIFLRMAKEDDKWNKTEMKARADELAWRRRQASKKLEANSSGQVQPA